MVLLFTGCKDFFKKKAEEIGTDKVETVKKNDDGKKQAGQPAAEPAPQPVADPFWLGADISWSTEMERHGERLYHFEGDTPWECTALMKDLGLNAVRLRVWVDPQAWEREQAEKRRQLLADKPASRNEDLATQARSRQRKQKADASASTGLMASAESAESAASSDGNSAEVSTAESRTAYAAAPEDGVLPEGGIATAEEMAATDGDSDGESPQSEYEPEAEVEPAYNHAGTCDKEDLLKKALRAKDLGMAVMVNFHYSDSWADPKKQPVPLGWKGHSYEQMKEDLKNHTVEVLSYLKNHGIDVKWVQIGNEVSNGLLWSYKTGREAIGPDGKPAYEDNIGCASINPEQYAGFIQAGCEASKSVYPDAKTIVHLDNGWDPALYEWNLGLLQKYGVQYDMVGMSLYPYWAREEKGRNDADGIITDCIKNVKSVYSRFGKESMIVETGFEVNEASEAVMKESKRQLLRLIREAQHDTDGHCKGVFYWEPECRPSKYRLGAFSSSGRPTIIMEAFKECSQTSGL